MDIYHPPERREQVHSFATGYNIIYNYKKKGRWLCDDRSGGQHR
jgi:hypothetical protein